jgi:pyridinium-3,5-bisthiocarboxylic acid mononucleotide nickel chelatase
VLAYFDLYSGASGDMIVGALLDAGLELASLHEGLATLPITGYTLSAELTMRGAVGATAFRVDVHEPQPERHLRDVVAIIERAALPEPVVRRAIAVFTALAEAEARIHRVPAERVHFHEVGSVDAIVDVVGTCLALHLLGVDDVYSSAFPVAQGSIQVAHGHIPLPGPAVLEIVRAAGAPLIPPPTDVRAELVTPTGAALICTLATFAQPTMTPSRIGYGAGAADLPHPNVLRVWMGEAAAVYSDKRDTIERLTLLETNIDDMNPQIFGYLFGRLLAAGALDVFCTPIVMKKNRPATMLSVLCGPENTTTLLDILFTETTTLGVRRQEIDRVSAGRTNWTVETPLGPVRVKVKERGGRVLAAMPEYEDCVALARQHSRPLLEVTEIVRRAAGARKDEA